MRKMKDSGIQWIGQIPEKERLEMRDKRKEESEIELNCTHKNGHLLFFETQFMDTGYFRL